MNDAELEAAVSDAWQKYLAAVDAKSPLASGLWYELQTLISKRTPEQRARALTLAGLNADGTPIQFKVRPSE